MSDATTTTKQDNALPWYKAVEWQNILLIVAKWLTHNAETIIIMITPVIAPLPSMWAVQRALADGGWGGYAGPVGGIVEAMGLASGAFMGHVQGHNRKHPTKTIPNWVGYGVFGFYLALVLGVLLFYEAIPAIVQWQSGEETFDSVSKSLLSLLFPGLTLIGSVIVGMRDFMRRVEDQAQAELNRQNEMEDKKNEKDDALFDLDLDIKRRKAELELEQEKAVHALKLELQREKEQAKLHKAAHKPAQSDAQSEVSTTGSTVPDMQHIVHLSKQEQAKQLHSEGFTNAEISRLLSVHRNSVGNWLKETNGNGYHK